MDTKIQIASWSLFSKNYFDVTRTSIFVLLGTLAIIVFGNTTGAEMAIAATIIASGLYAVLAGDDALRILDSLRADINNEGELTNFDKSLQSSPFLFFRAASALTFVAVVILQLMALF